MNPIDTRHIKKILVTRTDRIGDVVLSTPVFKALKEKFPHAIIVAMVLPNTREIIEGNPYVDHIITYDKRGIHKSFWKTIQFAYQLRREKIDCVIHLHPTNRVHIISCVAGIPIRIGYQKKCGWLLTHAIEEKKWEGKKHEALYNFDLLSLLNVPAPETIEPLFMISDDDRRACDQLVQSMSMTLSRYVVFFPSASCRSKMWPVERFAQLADIIHTQYGCTSVIVGSNSDTVIAEKMVSLMNTPVCNITGKVTLKVLGALFSNAELVISNDSGPVIR